MTQKSPAEAAVTFEPGAKNQGPQSAAGPAQQDRAALAALDRACKSGHGGKGFAELAISDQGAVLSSLESRKLTLDGVDGRSFFRQAIKDEKFPLQVAAVLTSLRNSWGAATIEVSSTEVAVVRSQLAARTD